jgi:beta-lactamase class D
MNPLPLLFLSLLLGCADVPPASVAAPESAPADSTADLSAFFPEGTDGTFVLYDAQSGVTTRYNPARAAERRTPASTFKIFNSLVALDAGAVTDEHEVVEWDGVERTFDSWNESQDLETAYRRSAVWVYQELARRVGRDTLQAYLDREDFGNATLSDSLEWTWLDGSLRISADEQIAFLRRLQAGETGFSDRAERIVKRIMIADTTGGAMLRGKTGWSWREDENLGWWVGWLERGDSPPRSRGDVYFFAYQVESDDHDFDMRGVRKASTERILRHLGVR